MLLYHFTCPFHLPSITESKVITRTESNFAIGAPHETHLQHVGPDVVWLTSQPSVKGEGWNALSFTADGKRSRVPPEPYKKDRIRFTVNIKHAQRWEPWAKRKGADRRSMMALAVSGGDSNSWFVSEVDIPIEDWVRIDDMSTMKCLYHANQKEASHANH